MSTPAETRKSRPTIGLALGSGSARGLAHIGVIRAIEESGIPVDAVAGSSIGALVGAAYASGRLNTLEQDFLNIDWKRIGTLLDPVFPRSGLIDGRRIAGFVRSHVSVGTVERLPIPFCAVATDLTSGREVLIRDGDVIDAVRASISMPGIFSPVRHREGILVDGGLANPVPVSAARALGADIVIAVDLNYNIVAGKSRHRPPGSGVKSRRGKGTAGKRRIRHPSTPAIDRIRSWLEKERLPGMIEVLLGSLHIMQEQITTGRLLIERPEVLIRPPLGSVRLLEFDRAEEIIRIGYRSALGPVRELAEALRQPNGPTGRT
jgi:NTE family protein